ncbi:flagellar hook-basal body complex protein FliE [Halobacillus massiliensis]|uniref:flagellar hook-basal body complex protein FliE n=1 Tax=Halobacillus massiliensis TaxID=1926286 RepID=UPI001FE530B7|nr:flagellar hook-basal body complex protein FliE [Halobacillus massiliensis]
MVKVTQLNAIQPKVQYEKFQTPANAHSQFASVLNNAIEQLNETQKVSDQMTKALAAGKANDLHNVMIASEKAGVTLQTTVEIRNKLIDAYKEIMRIQV